LSLRVCRERERECVVLLFYEELQVLVCLCNEIQAENKKGQQGWPFEIQS
jgi:hypothetical protein